jgi:hypothetical protein
MIKHIVFFKMNQESKAENIVALKKALEGLVGKVPTLLDLEVGVDFNKSAAASDLSLYTEFNTKEDLEAYQIHPEHLHVVELVKAVTCERHVVDYEV